jgi:hypothetical protein
MLDTTLYFVSEGRNVAFTGWITTEPPEFRVSEKVSALLFPQLPLIRLFCNFFQKKKNGEK